MNSDYRGPAILDVRIPFVSETLKILRHSLANDPEVLADRAKAKSVNRKES